MADQWLLSLRDGQVHQFRGRIGETAFARCPVTVPAVELQPGDDDQPRCGACRAIADRRERNRG